MRIKIDKLGDVGLVTDRTAVDLPPNAFTTLHNARGKNGYVQPVKGYEDLTTGTSALSSSGTTEKVHVHQLAHLDYEGTYWSIFPYDDDDDGVAETIFKWNGSTTTAAVNITREISSTDVDYTGTTADLWQVEEFNGIVVLNNGKDCPQYWDGVNTNCEPLPYDGSTVWEITGEAGETDTEFDTDNSGTANYYRAKVIRGFKNYLFAFHITEEISGSPVEYPHMVAWSDAADPGEPPSSWDYNSTTNNAGRTLLVDTAGYVLDGLSLGDQFMIYKEDAIYRVAFVGGQFVYDFELLTASHGLWAANCVVDIGNRHVVMGDGVVYMHAGGQPENILEGRAADAFFSQIDPDNYKKCYLTHKKSENEVWLCYPETGETWANKAYCWNYFNNTWYTRDIPYSSTIKPSVVTTEALGTWDDVAYSGMTWEDDTFDRPWNSRTYSPIGDTLVAAEQQLVQFNDDVTSDAVTIERTNLTLGENDDWSMLRTILPYATGAAFNLRVGGQDYLDGPVTWQSAQSFDPGSEYKQDWRVSNKVWAYRISGNTSYRVTGISFDVAQSGRR